MRYAIIRGSTVETVCEWDGNPANWRPDQGTTAIRCPAYVGAGFTYTGGVWTPPAPAPAAEPSDFSRLSPRDLLQAMVDAGALPAVKRDAVLDALKR